MALINEQKINFTDTEYVPHRRLTIISQNDAKQKYAAKNHVKTITSICQSTTPITDIDGNIVDLTEPVYDYVDTLKDHDYKIIKQIANTLQGYVLEAKHIATNEVVIVKMSEIKLHRTGTSKEGAKVSENIIKEMKLIKLLQKNNPPESFLRITEYFKDIKYYFIIMQHGGTSFFDYTVESHEKILEKKIALKPWKNHLKVLFKQMIEVINWLHNESNVCHLDISLENMVIKGVVYNEKKRKFINHGRLSLIDYGLSEKFEKDAGFLCQKYVGKIGYCDPYIFKQRAYDAKKADIYSLSICIFMAYLGAPPYKIPDKKDKAFDLLYYQRGLTLLLNYWHRSKYIPKEIVKLLNNIWVKPSKRLSIMDISMNKYFYDFNDDNYNIDCMMPKLSIQTNSNNVSATTNDKYSNIHYDYSIQIITDSISLVSTPMSDISNDDSFKIYNNRLPTALKEGQPDTHNDKSSIGNHKNKHKNNRKNRKTLKKRFKKLFKFL